VLVFDIGDLDDQFRLVAKSDAGHAVRLNRPLPKRLAFAARK